MNLYGDRAVVEVTGVACGVALLPGLSIVVMAPSGEKLRAALDALCLCPDPGSPLLRATLRVES